METRMEVGMKFTRRLLAIGRTLGNTPNRIVLFIWFHRVRVYCTGSEITQTRNPSNGLLS